RSAAVDGATDDAAAADRQASGQASGDQGQCFDRVDVDVRVCLDFSHVLAVQVGAVGNGCRGRRVVDTGDGDGQGGAGGAAFAVADRIGYGSIAARSQRRRGGGSGRAGGLAAGG